MTSQIPAWQPPWPSSMDPTFVRVSSSHLKDDTWLCPEQVAKKARPEVWPAVRGEWLERPPATFALGLVRDAALDLLGGSEPSPAEAMTAIAAAVAARVAPEPNGWVDESVALARRGLAGYLQVLARLRAAGDLGPAVAVGDLVLTQGSGSGPRTPGAAGAPRDDPAVEWVTWAIHHVSRDGSLCETHLLRFGEASGVQLAPAELAVIARVAAAGVVAQPKRQPREWSAPFAPAASQPPTPRRARVRVVGVLDGSDSVLFEGTSAEAEALAQSSVPAALQILAGGRFRPGQGCAACTLRQHCPGLPERPGLLGVAGSAAFTRPLSPSDLTRHARCPRQLHLLRDLGMPQQRTPPSGALLRGIQVHAWLAAAHERGVACTESDLPAPTASMVDGRVVRAAGIAGELGWTYEEYVTNRRFLLGHVAACPLVQEDLVSLTHELPATVWDTDADVVVTTRSDMAWVTQAGELVLRETKTVSARLVAPDEAGLLAQFPQLALAVCLLADGHPAFESLQPERLTVELELLGAAGSRLARFDATDPSMVLAARTALADRVDRWLFDTRHPPGTHAPCGDCPVERLCGAPRPVRVPEVPADLLLGLVDGPAAAPWAAVSADDVAALVDLDAAGPADDIPF